MNLIFKNIQHKISHMFGYNTGTIETFYSEDGILMSAFRCDCGKLSTPEPCNQSQLMSDIERRGKEIENVYDELKRM